MLLRQEVIEIFFFLNFVDIMQDSFNKALPVVKAWDDLVIQNKVWHLVITMHWQKREHPEKQPPSPCKSVLSIFSTDSLLPHVF